MDGRTRGVSLILPAFQEEAGIREAIAEADEALALLADDYEILVVDDGSRDGTATAVREEMIRRARVRLLQHETNRGYGAALRTGFEAARCELVAFTDADCQFHLADLAPLLRLAEDYPIAIGYRVDRQDPWLRRLYSWGYNRLTRALLGTRAQDCDCALKVFRREALLQILPETTGFFVNTEMLTRARFLGLRVAETGVRHRPRVRGQSSVSLRQVPRILSVLLPFWWSRVLFPGPDGLTNLAENPSPQARRESEGNTSPKRQRGEHTSPKRQRGEHKPEAPARGQGVPLAGASGLCDQPLRRGNNKSAAPAGKDGPTGTRCLLLVLLVAVALFFSRLGCPLLEPQEARYAEIPRQMLVQGSVEGWLTPVLNGQPYGDKPPLLYWLVMIAYSLFGVHDWAARLIPGLAGCLTVLLTFLWCRRVTGERAALAGALVLCLSARFVYLGRMLTFDIVLAATSVAALGAAHLALLSSVSDATPARSSKTPRGRLHPTRRGRLHRGWWLASALACGLGLLTKGPVALVLVAVPVVALTALDPRVARLRLRDGGFYLTAAGVVAAPWYVFMAVKCPGFLEHFFWRHHVIRFFAPFDHQEPLWFYLPGVLLGMLPWTLLLPGLLRFLARHSRRTALRRPPALGFFLLCGLWGLAFFSLSGCKRAVYILPVLPPLALALGCYLDSLLPRRLGATWSAFLSLRPAPALARQATLLVLALGAGAGLLAAAARLLPPSHGLALAVPTLPACVLLWRSGRGLTWAHCAAATFLLLLVGIQVLLPAYNRRFALRACIASCREQVNAESVPVMCYPRSWDSVGFYLGREVRVYSTEQRGQLIDDLQRQPRALLFVRAGRTADELLRALPRTVTFTAERQEGSILMVWVCSRARK
jgi:4-amino-4-deoxy-L-arabinose transferase-like glycosyltransferase